MEGRGSYRAREAHRPASLAGSDSSAAFHAVMVRGLMLNHHDATVGLIRDQIGWHAFRVKTKDGNRLAKCRLLPSLLSYLLQCVDFLFYGLGIIKLH